MSDSQTRSIIVEEIFWIMTMSRSNDDRVSETEVWFQKNNERLIIQEISLKKKSSKIMIKWKRTEPAELEKDARPQDLRKSFIRWNNFLIFGKFEIDWSKLFSEKKDERRGIQSEKRWKEFKKNRKRGEKKNRMEWD